VKKGTQKILYRRVVKNLGNRGGGIRDKGGRENGLKKAGEALELGKTLLSQIGRQETLGRGGEKK